MNVNLRAAFCCMRAALKTHAAAGRGASLRWEHATLSSVAQLRAYACSKAALVALVKNSPQRAEVLA